MRCPVIPNLVDSGDVGMCSSKQNDAEDDARSMPIIQKVNKKHTKYIHM